MMRGSVVFFAVLGVFSFSIGANDAYYIKSRLSDEGISNGSEEAARMGENAFGIGENVGGGHYIRKRSPLGLNLVQNLGHDMAKLATVKSAPARRRSMPNSKRRFSRPTPLRVYQGVPDVLPTFVPKSRPVFLRRNPLDLLLTKPQSIPSALNPMAVDDQMSPSPMLKFFPVADVTSKAIGLISTLLPKALPKSLIRNTLALNDNVYTPNRKNFRSEYPDLRTLSTLPSFQSFPTATINELLPLLPHVGNEPTTYMRAALDHDAGMRFSVSEYIKKLWNKLHSLVGSSPAPKRDPLPVCTVEGVPGTVGRPSLGGEDDSIGGRPPPEDDSIGGRPPPGDDDSIGGRPPPGEDDSIGGRPPPEDDGIGGRPPPGDDDSIGGHPPPGEDDSAGESSSEGGGGDDYEEPYKRVYHPDWEARRSDDHGKHYKRVYHPDWEARRSDDHGKHYKRVYHPDWEARRSDDYGKHYERVYHPDWEARRSDDYGKHYERVYHPDWEARRSDDYGKHYERVYHPDWEARSSSAVEDSIGDVTSTIEDTTAVNDNSALLSFLENILNAFGKLTHG